MLERSISDVLALFPRGATDDQLLWRLGVAGARVDASELLAGLNKLAGRGEIVREPTGRWRATPFEASFKKKGPETGLGVAGNHNVLQAAPATCRARKLEPQNEPVEQAAATGLPEWSSLLTYYAATQRKDPRGQITEFPDRHGRVWQLFKTFGDWWSDAQVHISMNVLPQEFREALTRRKTVSAAIGWPMLVTPTIDGLAIVPGLILPVDFRIDGETLTLDVEASEPSVNPAWIREIRRITPWTEASLLEQLFPEGEASDLGAVSDRMRHALATIDGATLRPGDLAFELTVAGKGLRNAAALFLPEDGTFTKGTAEDLELIRDWAPEARRPTVLATLLGSSADTPACDTPVLPLGADNDLTENQLAAADMALVGPLTVIQGPPGTGKSQVIVSMIVSAVMAGRTVLFAAKNHQAIDEVERRIRELVPEAPLLTRARDAEGARDSNFIDALNELSQGDHVSKEAFERTEKARKGIVTLGQQQRERLVLKNEITSLNLELCEISERFDAFSDVQNDKQHDRNGLAWLERLLQRLLFWKRPDLTAPLPEHAPRSALMHRRDLLVRRLKELTTKDANADGSSWTRMGDLLRASLSRFVDDATKPLEIDWRALVERADELKFNKTTSVRRMPVDDARAVLRYRPVWAVSTLSVPSRIPLVPALFDYVIFDEASQCDIASALPLLARARKAIVVGDPMQLRFVPQLGRAAEHALMDAAGLPKAGRASIAQSINSLFDFSARRQTAKRMFLADQFRSSPPIVDYLNADFYAGRLVGRRSHEEFKTPTGYRPGLMWEDITGHAVRNDNGTINIAEVDKIIGVLRRIATDTAFTGSVGIISPFNSQVAKLQSSISTAVSNSTASRLGIKVATVDKFQGAEADIILFSLVLAGKPPKTAETFLRNEKRRLNVAISRARALCIVVGDLAWAQACGIPHIQFLARRATTPWSPFRPEQFDSVWERRFDNAMRTRGLEPISQFPVGTRYLDFALDPEGKKINIEVDGRRWHTDASGGRKVSDRLRDIEMRSRGWRVLRFWVHELEQDMEGCLDRIEREIAGN